MDHLCVDAENKTTGPIFYSFVKQT